MLIDVNYNDEFIINLRRKIGDKIAFISDKDLKNEIYDLGLCSNPSKHQDLIEIYNILDKVLKCSSCYKGMEIEDIVAVAQNILNE